MRHDLTGCQRQTDGHTGLRQQARAKVLFHVLVTLAHDAAKRSAEGLAGHSQHDVDHADEADRRQHRQLEVRAGRDEEQQKDRRRHAVADVHDLRDIRREVRHDRAHGHAQQQG